jgi:primase-polymerase (primpol)-like protein
MTPTFRVPDDLIERDQWVVWRFDHGTKVPRGSTTDPGTWCAFDEAVEVWRRNPQRWAGVGYVFHESDPFVGLDLDNSLDDGGVPKTWAQSVIERFYDCYTEVSPSGHGVKIWAKGKLPANLPKVRIGDGGIELYDHARYFTVTGRVFRGAPLQIEDHAADIAALYHHLTVGKRKTWTLQPLQGGRIPHGQQHSTLVSIAGTLRARRLCDEAILACLLAVNAHQCERPGRPEDIGRIVQSSRKWVAA